MPTNSDITNPQKADQEIISQAVAGNDDPFTRSPVLPENTQAPAESLPPQLPPQSAPLAQQDQFPSQTTPLAQQDNLQPSIMSQAPEPAPIGQTSQAPAEEDFYPQTPASTTQDFSQDYSSYGSYDQGYSPQGSLSSDTITEISEQVVDEKLATIKDALKSIIDIKNTTETKTSSLEKRIKRIEEIIDALQISVIKKLGEYTTFADDIKTELHETQKSIKHHHKTHKK